MYKFLSVLILLTLTTLFFGCGEKKAEAQAASAVCSDAGCDDASETNATCADCPSASGQSVAVVTQNTVANAEQPLITFVELGSVNCIPCKKMQPVMKSIEEKYADQVQVIFYDVWKADQRQYAEQYKIRLIPTQVFLDKDGKEIFRHEGFFPEAEIDAFLKKQGLVPGQVS